MEEKKIKPKTGALIGAVIMFGLAPLMYVWGLFQAISTNQATPSVILIYGGLTLGSWGLLYYLIQQSKKPPVVLTPEEKAIKDDKEGRQAVAITPFLIFLIMYLKHNYTSWVLWGIIGLCAIGWIQFLPKKAQDFIGTVTGSTFKKIWQVVKFFGWILFIILAIWGIISLFQGLVALTTTQFLLLLILWAILSKE
jgi:hypothetical protein